MTKNYDVAGMTLAQYLKKTGDVGIGLVENGYIFNVEDFDEVDDFIYEEGFAINSYSIGRVVDRMNRYHNDDDTIIPTALDYELKYIIDRYVVAYEEVDEQGASVMVWMKKKECAR